MIIASILFLLGLLIGLSYNFLAIGLASLAVTLIVIPLWAIRGELGLFTLLVWLGYLLALQSGFLVAGYLRTRDDP